jgi:hypothetical protein
LRISEALDFKFLLKPKDDDSPCFVEEGPSRVIIGGALQGGTRLASFKLDNDQAVEYKVFVQASRVSSFDLAASWRAYKENFHLSAVRGIPDVSINSEPQTESEVRFQLPICFMFVYFVPLVQHQGTSPNCFPSGTCRTKTYSGSKSLDD